jgi:RND family efflux transporter MFP subunit
MSETKHRILKIVLPFAVVALGIAAFVVLKSLKPKPPQETPPESAVLVEVSSVHTTRADIAVQAQGSVVPAQRVALQAELAGRVVWQNASLVPGGRFRSGESILRLDGRDYHLAVETRRADVQRAQLELRIEDGRRVVAEREWRTFGEPEGASDDTSGRQLALREPQRQTAQVGVESAQSALDRATLDLSRTTLRAPFNALVMEEQVDRGQLVAPQSPLATLVGTDHYWVQVSVPVASLAAIRLPAGDTPGAAAHVVQRAGDQRIEREGRVVRLLPDVDPVGSMARLLVEIDDPLGLSDGEPDALPILLGSYVDVAIEASSLDDVIEVPRVAVREGNRVFVMNGEGRLELREVEVVWSRPQSILVRGGLRSGERIVTTPIAAPIPGMLLRTREPAEAPARASTDAETAS